MDTHAVTYFDLDGDIVTLTFTDSQRDAYYADAYWHSDSDGGTYSNMDAFVDAYRLADRDALPDRDRNRYG
jgi:hypothetical protein